MMTDKIKVIYTVVLFLQWIVGYNLIQTGTQKKIETGKNSNTKTWQ